MTVRRTIRIQGQEEGLVLIQMTEVTDGEENQPGNIKKIDVEGELDLPQIFQVAIQSLINKGEFVVIISTPKFITMEASSGVSTL